MLLKFLIAPWLPIVDGEYGDTHSSLAPSQSHRPAKEFEFTGTPVFLVIYNLHSSHQSHMTHVIFAFLFRYSHWISEISLQGLSGSLKDNRRPPGSLSKRASNSCAWSWRSGGIGKFVLCFDTFHALISLAPIDTTHLRPDWPEHTFMWKKQPFRVYS